MPLQSAAIRGLFHHYPTRRIRDGVAIRPQRITKTFAEWHQAFIEHSPARRAHGIENVMCASVIGSQEVIYVVRTDNPRQVHDMSWSAEAKAIIEASRHVLGSEVYTVCEETA